MKRSLLDKLNQRKKEGTFRSLICLDGLVDFWSNDYLGVSKKKISVDHQEKNHGSTGSRLISGNSDITVSFERFLSDHFRSQSALCFNSGYDANLGFFSAVPQKGDLVLYDEHIHASIRDGIRLSFASGIGFRHNDLNDLQEKLRRAADKYDCIYVVVESLYSMHGDFAPLSELTTICDNERIFLVVDEAHSAGIFGENGSGLSAVYSQNIFARIITFGKAYGAHGAAILGSEDLKDFLINFSRPFIYTTALPTSNWRRLEKIFKSDLSVERKILKKNIEFFNSLTSEIETFSSKESQIRALRLGDRETLHRAQEDLRKKGFAVKAIYSPTVSEQDECLRINIHSFNDEDQITQLIRCIDSLNS
ncbi:MAG: aminotransferase class I/II-fold pyridoxal phosphate-dependent enzyme [Bacteroidetes bacterium]|nr:MAG: aminotransferase class I/II-fold pyridoxal phosphate-dependent enzyme [Bacteroidota bacterium]